MQHQRPGKVWALCTMHPWMPGRPPISCLRFYPVIHDWLSLSLVQCHDPCRLWRLEWVNTGAAPCRLHTHPVYLERPHWARTEQDWARTEQDWALSELHPPSNPSNSGELSSTRTESEHSKERWLSTNEQTTHMRNIAGMWTEVENSTAFNLN